jgi:hypothetical protein
MELFFYIEAKSNLLKMKNKVFLSMTLVLTSLLISSCGGWTDERKEKIMGKCIEDKFDCDCYLKVTMEKYPDPEDYNKKSEKDEAYKKTLKVECGIGWEDDEFMPLYEKCDTELYDCDCAVTKIVDSYPNKSSFDKAINENPDLFEQKLGDCRLDK